MDFGDILKKWEGQNAGTEAYDKDAVLSKGDAAGKTGFPGERRRRLLKKKPDASIDLHGLTKDEAWNALEAFFANSAGNGFEKVLIIHGKGNHRGGGNEDPYSAEGALRDLSRRFIESCPHAGESGFSHIKEGGSGATWVILKEKKT